MEIETIPLFWDGEAGSSSGVTPARCKGGCATSGRATAAEASPPSDTTTAPKPGPAPLAPLPPRNSPFSVAESGHQIRAAREKRGLARHQVASQGETCGQSF